MAETLTGGCGCGAVRYAISADFIFSGNCYCEDCRKMGSSGHSAVFAVPEPSLQLTGQLTEYRKTGGSGQPITRRFCPVCGTRVWATAAVMPGVALITASTLDDPARFTPQSSIFTSRAPSWDRPPHDLPQFPEMPPQG